MKGKKGGFVGHRKGFPVQLPKTHWLTVQQSYTWLKAHDATTPEMDEVAKMLPTIFVPSSETLAQHLSDESTQYGWYNWPISSALTGRKTVRFRAEHVLGAIQLLRAAAIYCPHGQVPGTLLNRVERLEQVNELDLLVDASR